MPSSSELIPTAKTAAAQESEESTVKTPKERRIKRSSVSDQRQLLAFYRDTAPNPGGASAVTLKEMVDCLGWSTLKVLEVRTDLLDAGRLLIVERLGRDMRPVAGHLITEAGYRFLGDTDDTD